MSAGGISRLPSAHAVPGPQTDDAGARRAGFVTPVREGTGEPGVTRARGASDGRLRFSVGPRPQDTSCEAWRHRCEVVHVANMPSREARAVYIMDIERKRGREAAMRLRDDVIAEWNRASEGGA